MKSFLKNIYKRTRIFLLTTFKYNFKSVGKQFYCGKRLIIEPGTVSLGDYVYIGHHCNLSVKKLVIQDYVMLASDVAVVGGDHRFDKVGTPIIFSGRGEGKGVVIERDVWIGHGSIILDGVTVGEGSVVAAGSIVTKDVFPYSIYAGVPAKKIKDRFSDSIGKKRHIELLKNYKKKI